MNWPVVALEALAAPFKGSITDGPFGSNLAREHYRESGPRVIRLQNIGDGNFVDSPAHIAPEHFEKLRRHEVLPGDLLIASLGDALPRACLAPSWLGPAIVKADCIRVRLGAGVDPRWVKYAMQTPAARKWADDRLHGVGRLRLGLKGIREIPVPLPPLPEQLRIVEILEDQLSRLDAADHLMKVAARRAQGLLLAYLSEQVRHLCADSFPVVAIGDVAQTSLGKMLDAKKAEGELTPYLANINVRWGEFDLTNLKQVRLTPPERDRLALEPGDVLVCEGGEPGRCAVWQSADSGVAYQKALHRIRIHDTREMSPEFLSLMLREAIQSGRSDSLFTGTTIKHLPQEKLRQIRIPVPDVDVQLKLVAEAGHISEATRQLRGSLESAARRSRGLRDRLLAAAFSGRLTGHPSTHEMIEELTGV